jgi:radical SAM superfamily enzyme YgiQ (UPF0313 family)
MKIAIAYPPIKSKKGVPLLSQNRQFQWFHKPTYIYPMIPAYAATLLKNNQYEVIWMDGIAEEKDETSFKNEIIKEKPDLIAIEAKTPIIKFYWNWINEMKEILPKTKFVLMGDHVTALPYESFENSKVDYVLTGGDFDFLLLNLVNHITKKENLEPGIYFKENGEIINTGKFLLNHDLNTLPFIDRDLTKWWLYAYKNGNFKYTPGTYTMIGRDCWWGKCSFCAWTTLYPKYRVAKPEKLLDEIGILIEKYKVKEIFDDTGTFPVGDWLRKFCNGMIERGYNKKVTLGCNMRTGALTYEDFVLMKKANFRFLLFGVESANQYTLDRINKRGKVEEFETTFKLAKRAGLEPHATCMVGYPWETKEDAKRTINLTKSLFDRGYLDTLQATIVIPYPGTPLFEECKEKNLLKTLDWERYDMREPVMKTSIPDEEILKLTQGIYKSFLTPRFVIRKILSIRSFTDIKFLINAGLRVISHLLDFHPKSKC